MYLNEMTSEKWNIWQLWQYGSKDEMVDGWTQLIGGKAYAKPEELKAALKKRERHPEERTLEMASWKKK